MKRHGTKIFLAAASVAAAQFVAFAAQRGAIDPAQAALIADDPPFVRQSLALDDMPKGTRAEPLFNGRNLDGWDKWLGITDASKILTNTTEKPIGLNTDPTGVYSVVVEDGSPAIRISGTINGVLMSKDEFEDYHLHLQFKWGRPARPGARPNSGLIYHSHGPLGACFDEWMAGIEFAIQRGNTGSTIPIGAADGAHTYADMNWHVGMSVPVGQDQALGYPKRRFMVGGRIAPVAFPAFSVQPALDA
ncbi:MAG: DUF1080 domain-containing protein, partial [Vicinamibacterales bacterium]